MCDHDNREAAMTVIERDGDGRPTVFCDPCIAPLVKALNAEGVPTVASCCGHGSGPGSVALRDGRVLAILPDLEAYYRMLVHLSPRPAPVADREELVKVVRAALPKPDHGDRRDLTRLADDMWTIYAYKVADVLIANGYVKGGQS